MSYRCIICLESLPAESLKRLCTGCNESRVCLGCVEYAVENGFDDRLSNCSICNRPTDFHYQPKLQPTYQILTLGFWWIMGLKMIPWKSFVIMQSLYSCFHGLCSRQDRAAENSPRTLVLKWKVLMGMIHVPYYLFFISRRVAGNRVFTEDSGKEFGTISEEYDDYLSEYVLAHGVFPILTVSVIWVYKTMKRIFGR